MPRTVVPAKGIGSKGVSSDMAPAELPLELFSYAEDCYYKDGQVRNVPKLEEQLKGSHGTVLWVGYRYDTVTKEPEIIYVGRNEGTGADSIYIIKKSNLTKTNGDEKGIVASRASGAYTNIAETPYNKWQGFVSHGMVVLTNGVDVPQLLKSGTDVFVNLPNWADTMTCKSMMPYKAVWIAMNTTDSSKPAGSENERTTVRWSSPITGYNEEPSSWEVLDLGGDPTGAGNNVLGDTPGEIITGALIRDAFLIYKTDSVVRVDYTGNALSPFTFRTLFEDTGVWGVSSITPLRNEHLVVSQNDVYITDGYQKKSVIRNRIKDIFDTLVFSSTFAYDVVVAPDYTNEQVYVAITTQEEGGAGYKTQAYAFNYVNGDWFPRTFAEMPYVTYMSSAAMSSGDPVKLTLWDAGDNVAWDDGASDSTDIWDKGSDVLSVPQTMFCGGDKWYTYGVYRNAETGHNCIIKKYDMNFDELIGVTSRDIKRLLRLYPITDSTPKGHLIIKVWGHSRPGEAVQESDKKYYLFDLEADHKVDMSVSGRYISLEITTDETLRDTFDSYNFQNNPTKPSFNKANLFGLASIDINLAVLQQQ